MRRLPDTELAVMQAVWAEGGEVSRQQLEQALAPRRWAANTINTYLARLLEKGFLSARRAGKSNLYTPLISREDYLAFDSRSVLSQLYGGSPRNFLAALARGGLERPALAELRALLDELEGGEDG